MSIRGLRPLSAAVLILLFSILSTAVASAHTTGKSINTTTGECTGSGCGSLVYGGSGISGRLFGTGTVSLFDYVCVHKPSDAAPDSFGGTYTLTVTSGGVVLASTSYTVASGADCRGHGNSAAGSPAKFTYPSSGFVDYAVSISGVTPGNAQSTFSHFDSIFDRVVDPKDEEDDDSPPVAPPGPTGEVPEVPAAALLILTGGLGAGWFLLRRRSDDSSITTS